MVFAPTSINRELDRSMVLSQQSEKNLSLNKVLIWPFFKNEGIIPQLSAAISSVPPDFVLVSTEDFGQARLRAVQRIFSGKIIYLAHTPQFLPFGCESFNPYKKGTQAVEECALVITIGQYMREYCQAYLSSNITVVHPPLYGSPPFRNYGDPAKGFILMINPCSIKGLPIFLDIARQCEGLDFAVLPGWGTTSLDIAESKRCGIKILPSPPNIDEVLAQTRVLVVPSLWTEGFGLIVIEAMLRGIPVISSEHGGLTEAKMGTQFQIPIHPITEYTSDRDERMMPVPVIPRQDIRPWVAALKELTSNETLYTQASMEASRAANEFVAKNTSISMEATLTKL